MLEMPEIDSIANFLRFNGSIAGKITDSIAYF